MIYRELGRTGLSISRLGFGAMRLPSTDGRLDPDASVRLLHAAFERGLNYVDTAVMYCGFESEGIVGRAVREWPGRIVVSTKNHYVGPDERAWWTNLENSLEKLGVGRIDVYNVHGISWEKWERWVRGPNGILAWMHKARDQGLIDHVCCSFHDSPEALGRIAATGEFESITLQYNMLYRDLEPVIPEVAGRGIGIVVMGPVGGGRLQEPSEKLRGIVDNAGSTPEVALRFVLSNPHVTAAISGMGTLDMVEENCATASREEPLSEREHTQINDALDRIKALADLYCTGCNYCMPCPSGVDIPGNFLAMNHARVYGLEEQGRRAYGRLGAPASFCLACGSCEPKCPQKIPITRQLAEVAARFDPAYGSVAVAVQPVRLEGQTLHLRAIGHNLSDQPAVAVLRFRSGGGVVRPGTVELAIDEAFHIRGADLAIGLGEGPLPSSIDLSAAVEDPAGEREEAFRFVLGACAPDDDASSPGLGFDDAPRQVFAADGTRGELRGARVDPRYDHEAISMRVLVPGAAAAATTDGAVPSVFLLIDLRPRTHLHPPGYHDRMWGIRIMPFGDDADGRTGAERLPVVRVPRGDADPGEIECGQRIDGNDAVLDIRLPWALLGVDPPRSGDVAGFDFLVEARDREGRHIFRAGWSGNPRVPRDGRGGVLVFTS